MNSTSFISGYVGTAPVQALYIGAEKVWPSEIDYSRQYMTFDILSSGTIMFKSNNATAITKEIQYSINNGSWITFNSSGNTGFTVSAGDKVRFKGENARYGTLGATSPRATFLASTAIFDVYGNIMSMVYGDNFIGQTELDSGGYNFVGFFNGAKVVNAENLILPMETIPDRAFINFMLDSPMLKYAPKEIPATTIGVLAMQGAFARCPELERASEYSVTNVGASAFTQTYLQDYSLTEGPSVLPIETMGNYACNGMFESCSALTTAPVLSAAIISARGYYHMFYGCRSLNYIKCLATTRGSNARQAWVQNVASTGTFVKQKGASWSTGISAIPTGWVVEQEGETNIQFVTAIYGSGGTENEITLNFNSSSALKWRFKGKITTISSDKYIYSVKTKSAPVSHPNYYFSSFGYFEWLISYDSNKNSLHFDPSFTEQKRIELDLTFGNNYVLSGSTTLVTGDTRTAPSYPMKICIDKLRLQVFQAWEGDTLIFDGVPAKRVSDNYLGIYDMVSNQFFTPTSQNNLYCIY